MGWGATVAKCHTVRQLPFYQQRCVRQAQPTDQLGCGGLFGGEHRLIADHESVRRWDEI
jgi:hypothetical protein